MSLLKNNLYLLIRCMEQGTELKLKSGHTLVWDEEHNGPGFLATSHNSSDGVTEEIILQINSDVAWMSLVDHARNITEKETFILQANSVLNNINRKKR